MESLSDETWDVVIAGTSLPQSLLALALSKCDVRVLHVDENDYYGGLDAGLSLDEAEKWIQTQPGSDSTKFLYSRLASESTLAPSRAYTIALKPQIIYARSRFLPTLVSSQIHSQLEFQAVGSFWVHTNGNLQKIPSNREAVFADDTISVRDKRRLMGLLRYVLEEQKQDQAADGRETNTLEAQLQSQFKLPENLRSPVQALTLSTDTLSNVQFDTGMSRLKLHLTSIGYFGPGLAAVMAKYGGNAEIAQVACRAGAVGGFVYLLGHGLSAVETPTDKGSLTSVRLSEGTTVKTKYVVGTAMDLPREIVSSSIVNNEARHKVSYQISIISNPLRPLFAPTSENGPVPAVAIVLVGDVSKGTSPLYLQVHSEDTGECPNGQSVIYGSCLEDSESTQERLRNAIDSLISTAGDESRAQVLWSMSFIREESATGHLPTPLLQEDSSGKILMFSQRSHDIAFDDTILDGVKAAWERILGDRSTEYDFLRFEARRDENEDDG